GTHTEGPFAGRGMGRGRRPEKRPDLPDEAPHRRRARGLQLGASAAAAAHRRGPPLHRAFGPHVRVWHLDAALGTERRAPPLRFPIQRIQLRPLAAPDAGRPGRCRGRRLRRSGSRPRPQRVSGAGLEGRVGTQQAGPRPAGPRAGGPRARHRRLPQGQEGRL
ncbi:MAG: hypothetical protein AVDCRST_MAG03-1943, partial [uncultured Rubrobacteraceae bacterium]